MRIVWIILCAALVVGCGKKGSSGPTFEPGQPVGDVREVTGTVTATRASGAARALAVGDEVSGDDVIETAADSSVVIELRHNGVRWSLGSGQKKQVALSAAWKAPRGGGGSVDDRSTAAGRHAEREAADTTESAVATADEASGGGSGAPGAVMAQPAPTAAPAPAAPAAAAPAPEEPPPPPKPEPVADEGRYKIAKKSSGEKPMAQAGIGVEVTAATGGRDTAEVKSELSKQLRPLLACWQSAVDGGATAGGDAKFQVTLREDGTVSNVTGVADAPVKGALDCLEQALRKMSFGARDATADLGVTLHLGL